MDISFSFSVIICTRNRSDQLREALCHWEKVDCSFLKELVIVNNGSVDDTQDVINSFIVNSDLPVVSVYEGTPGLSRARNKGFEMASGDVIAFTDDDCYPKASYIIDMASVFKGNPEVGFLGGRVLLFDGDDLPITIQTTDYAFSISTKAFFKAGLVHGANFAIRKKCIPQPFQFDERFGAGAYLESGEDTDFIGRLLWSGVQGIYDPRPVVYHHHGRRENFEAKKLHRGYAIGRGAYYMKFILNKHSRSSYLKAWISEFKRDFDKQRLLELLGAFRYLLSRRPCRSGWEVVPD